MSNINEVPTDQLLSFQEFTPVHGSSYPSAQLNVDNSQKSFDNFGQQPEETINKNLLEENESPGTSRSFWTVEYYQQLFDVDTKDVVQRILASVIPKRGNYLKNYIHTKPDLYGPIWISITLIFTIAISGNIANYLQYVNKEYHWRYDFHLVSYAATAIFCYVCFVPLALWGVLRWSVNANLDEMDEDPTPSILELVCVYGYSLFIYIPASILWTIQISWFQWLLVLLATFLSGSVLLFTLTPSLKRSRHRIILTVGIIGFHLLLAAGFMLYFFHVPSTTTSTVTSSPVTTAPQKITAKPN